jgi:hypothetical protein
MYGVPLTNIDPTEALCIFVQNPQYALQASSENEELMHTILNLQKLQALLYAAISQNINFCNTAHTALFKHYFQKYYKQVQVSARSCDIGLNKHYRS